YFTRNLAAALLAGEWRTTAMQDRALRACGKRMKWLRPLVNRVLAEYPHPPGGDPLGRFLQSDAGFQAASVASLRSPTGRRRLQVVEAFWFSPHMAATLVPVLRPLPELPTIGAVAAWLGIYPHHLDWFADIRDWNANDPKRFGHYRYRWIPKRGRPG